MSVEFRRKGKVKEKHILREARINMLSMADFIFQRRRRKSPDARK